jgi:hypothetical protein
MRTPAPRHFTHCALRLLSLWVVWLLAAPAAADVPFGKIYFDNAIEVQNQEAFPDWMVVVFPSAPPSGRPAAWPALVEAGFHTEIDRNVLGTPKLWLLKASDLPALSAAAEVNDNQLDGPVAALLRDKGVSCLELELEKSSDYMPLGAPSRRLNRYRLEEASESSCKIRFLDNHLTSDDFIRGPRWALFSPKKRPKAAASASASASASTSVAPAAPVLSASAVPSATSEPRPQATTPAAPAPASPPAKSGCGCEILDARGADPPVLLVGLGLFLLRRIHRPRAGWRSATSATGRGLCGRGPNF